MRKFAVVMGSDDEAAGLLRARCMSGENVNVLPQKRDRPIIISSPGNFSWGEPEAKRPVALAEILEPEPTPHIPDYVNRRLAGKYRDKPIITDSKRGDIAEYARLQVVPDTFHFLRRC